MKTINKALFINNLDTMINNAEKGPSGFWYDTEDCCGNSDIFDEIRIGIKEHRPVYLEKDICPWNREVMYGSNAPNLHTGCFHQCGLRDAKYLSTKMIKDILLRYKKRYLNGDYEKYKNYDCNEKLRPLLTESEENHIKKEQHLEPIRERNKKLKAAENAIKMNPNDKEWIGMLGAYYGTNTVQMLYGGGSIDFSKEYAKNIVGGENLTYDECLYLQYKSIGKKQHSGFQTLYYNIPLGFKGQIERKSKGHICFKRIYFDGMYPDGVCFFGKEDHVWMNEKNFEEYNVGDCLEFFAEIYRYIKKSDGKVIDFGIRNPQGIKKIEKYKLPSNNQLRKQATQDIICETCYLSEHCNKVMCIRDKQEINSLVKSMISVMESSKKNIEMK